MSGKNTGVKETPCPLCNNQVNADEDHFSLVCPELQDLRAKYLSKCYQQNPTILKLDQLMILTSTVRLTHLSMYCKLVTDCVRCKRGKLEFCAPYRVTNVIYIFISSLQQIGFSKSPKVPSFYSFKISAFFEP